MTEKEFREKERRAAAKRAAAKKKAKKRKQALIALSVTLSVIVLSIVALITAVLLRVDTVEIVGNSLYSAVEIVEAADVEAGKSIVFLNKEAITEKLQKKLPFIEEVRVEKHLPSTIKITVTETTEEMCFYNSGKYYTASKNGKILDEMLRRPEKLPVIITGEGFVFEKGCEYRCNESSKTDLLNTLLEYCNKTEEKETIINISDIYNCYIVTENKLVSVLGSSSYIDGKLKFLTKMTESLKNENYNYFNLSDWTPDNDEAYSQFKESIDIYLEIK